MSAVRHEVADEIVLQSKDGRLNAILYRIALAQARTSPEAQILSGPPEGRGQDLARSDAGAQALPDSGHLAPLATMSGPTGAPGRAAGGVEEETHNERRTQPGSTRLCSPSHLAKAL